MFTDIIPTNGSLKGHTFPVRALWWSFVPPCIILCVAAQYRCPSRPQRYSHLKECGYISVILLWDIMSAMASQNTSFMIVYSTVYSRSRSNKASKLRVTDLCEGNSPVTSEFPSQSACNAENVPIWRRHHGGTGLPIWILILWIISYGIKYIGCFRIFLLYT